MVMDVVDILQGQKEQVLGVGKVERDGGRQVWDEVGHDKLNGVDACSGVGHGRLEPVVERVNGAVQVGSVQQAVDRVEQHLENDQVGDKVPQHHRPAGQFQA